MHIIQVPAPHFPCCFLFFLLNPAGDEEFASRCANLERILDVFNQPGTYSTLVSSNNLFHITVQWLLYAELLLKNTHYIVDLGRQRASWAFGYGGKGECPNIHMGWAVVELGITVQFSMKNKGGITEGFHCGSSAWSQCKKGLEKTQCGTYWEQYSPLYVQGEAPPALTAKPPPRMKCKLFTWWVLSHTYVCLDAHFRWTESKHNKGAPLSFVNGSSNLGAHSDEAVSQDEL